MTNSQPLDMRIADWLIRRLKAYKQKRKVALRKQKWNSSFVDKNYFIHSLEDNLSIKLFKGSELSRYIFDGFENMEIQFLKNFLQPGDMFIDIGANIGLFSLYAAKHVGESGTVISFEPTPDIYKRFNENIELNHFNNVNPVNIGLSDSKTSLRLQVSENGLDGWNTFAKSSDSMFTGSIEVPVDTLDNFIADNNIPLNKLRFIKIDVEGWEIPVIKGALQTINVHDDIILMVEFTESNAAAAGYNISDLYNIVVEQGFKWYVYDEQNNCLIYDAKRESYPYNNLFAVKDITTVNELLRSKSK
ncbi:hypothetical protein BH11BAC6_BH11BAC6_11960 [soil metagenome]